LGLGLGLGLQLCTQCHWSCHGVTLSCVIEYCHCQSASLDIPLKQNKNNK